MKSESHSPESKKEPISLEKFVLHAKDKEPSVPSKLMLKPVFSVVEGLTGLSALNRIYGKAHEIRSDEPFYEQALHALNVEYEVEASDWSKIPKEGPIVLVANHPFGAVEGLMLASLLHRARPTDFRIIANFMMNTFPEAESACIYVNPFGGKEAQRENLKGMRAAMEWVKNGGALGIFPSGEVAHFEMKHRGIVEPPWQPNIARLIRKTKATVVPIYFAGRNSANFQLLGMVHPLLRTAMLPREMLNKQNHRIRIKIGTPVSPKKLKTYVDDQGMMEYLRNRTLLLGFRAESMQVKPTQSQEKAEYLPIVNSLPSEHLLEDVQNLPPTQFLIENGDFQVAYAYSSQIPHLMHEIGRLREVTFRQTGEGTGKSIDLDQFDEYYLHLFIWNQAQNELVGAYRLGQADKILERYGKKGLYTSTLFKYKKRLLKEIGPALEMGRSFVREEYQKSFWPLMLLWKGITQYVIKHPDYHVLFGPVSIHADYHAMSRQLMVRYLKTFHYNEDYARLVKARKPFRYRPGIVGTPKKHSMAQSLDELSELIADVETEHLGIPILLKQYLKLGGELIGFNLDRHFSNVLDGLIVVDVAKTDRKIMLRYMGQESMERFLEYHAVQDW